MALHTSPPPRRATGRADVGPGAPEPIPCPAGTPAFPPPPARCTRLRPSARCTPAVALAEGPGTGTPPRFPSRRAQLPPHQRRPPHPPGVSTAVCPGWAGPGALARPPPPRTRRRPCGFGADPREPCPGVPASVGTERRVGPQVGFLDKVLGFLSLPCHLPRDVPHRIQVRQGDIQERAM